MPTREPVDEPCESPEDREIAQEMRQEAETIAVPVTSLSLIDEKFLDLIRVRPCWFCGASGPSDPHHLNGRGRGEYKRNDFCTIPLCRADHQRVANIGMTKMLLQHGLTPVDLAEWVARRVANYFLRDHTAEAPF